MQHKLEVRGVADYRVLNALEHRLEIRTAWGDVAIQTVDPLEETRITNKYHINMSLLHFVL